MARTFVAMASTSCQETITVAASHSSGESQAATVNGSDSQPAAVNGSESTTAADDSASRVTSNVQEELKARGMELRDILPPRPTSLVDALIVFVVHMLPFTPVPVAVTITTFIALKSYFGWLGPIALLTFFAYCLIIPPHYSLKIRRRARFLYEAMVHYMQRVRVILPAQRLPPGPYIFAFHPHGRMFYSCLLSFQLNHALRDSLCPQGDFLGFAASGFFYVPILRNLFYLVGIQPADRHNIVNCLRGKNHVALVIGGIKEVCLGTNNDTDMIYLRNRKGFIRVAMEEGAGIIPIFSFNENQLFRHDPVWYLQFWERVNRRFNIGVPFMRGIWHLPMPFRRELLIVLGHPLFPREGESVDSFHSRYIHAVEKLFHDYVYLSPDPSKKLLIV